MNLIKNICLCFKSHGEQQKKIQNLEEKVKILIEGAKVLVRSNGFYKDKEVRYNKIFCTGDPRLTNIDPLTGIDRGVTMIDDGKCARGAESDERVKVMISMFWLNQTGQSDLNKE